MSFIVGQWFSTRGDFPPAPSATDRYLAISEDIFVYVLLKRALKTFLIRRRIRLIHSGQKPRMLLNILKCTRTAAPTPAPNKALSGPKCPQHLSQETLGLASLLFPCGLHISIAKGPFSSACGQFLQGRIFPYWQVYTQMLIFRTGKGWGWQALER